MAGQHRTSTPSLGTAGRTSAPIDRSMPSGRVARSSSSETEDCWKVAERRKESRVSNGEVVPETKGVAVELLGTVDLTGEIAGVAGPPHPVGKGTHDAGAHLCPPPHATRPAGPPYIPSGAIT